MYFLLADRRPNILFSVQLTFSPIRPASQWIREWWSTSWRKLNPPISAITSLNGGWHGLIFLCSCHLPVLGLSGASQRKTFRKQHCLVAIWQQWVVHVFHTYPRCFFWVFLFFPPRTNHTLSYTYQNEIKECLLFWNTCVLVFTCRKL